VQPPVHSYLARLEDDLGKLGYAGPLYIMLSSGGITTVDEAKAFPIHLLESGPAAGAMAAAFIARTADEKRIISFDMGGTTAKMCLVEDGRPHIKHEFEAGRIDRFKPGSGLPLKLTVVDMIEIGSGGGSIAAVDELGLLKVGPRSASAVPGPVAYGRGGEEPTVTDCDLLLGYLDPQFFLGGEMTLSLDAVREALEQRLARALGFSVNEVALGIQEIVTENMAAATRMHLAEKGRDARDYTLMALGGAGPVHAYALAKRLSIGRVIVPMGAGVISAFGLLVAPPAVNEVRSYTAPLERVDWLRVAELYHAMMSRALDVLRAAAGVNVDEPVVTRSADMRYVGQGFEVEVPLPAGELAHGQEAAIRAAFIRTYEGIFGRTIEDVPLEIVNWRLSARLPEKRLSLAHRPGASAHERRPRRITFPGFGERMAAVYDRYALAPGTIIRGPAVFEERESSFAVGPDCVVTVDASLNLIAAINAGVVND
jgi:N-methylhydantoinase A